MMTKVYRREDCRACMSRELEHVFSLNPTPIGDEYLSIDEKEMHQPTYPIDLHICKKCGLAQLVDVIDPEVLYGNYIYKTESSVGLRDHFKRYAQQVIRKIGLKKNSNVLDIGSNDGTLLEEFKEYGMQVTGIEPAPRIAEYANKKGITTFNRYFSESEASILRDKVGAFELITSNNVFANVDNIRSWCSGVRILLKNDGFFIFESFYLPDLIQNMVFDFIYHEHLSSFSVLPVKKLFEEFGLALVSVERVDTKGGSLRYYICNSDSKEVSDGSVDDFIKKEFSSGIYSKNTYVEFRRKIDRSKFQLKNVLVELKNNKKVIAGYGASITGTTLIYDFEIGCYLDFLIDDNPDKIGRYSPGLKLPVFSSDALEERAPDYVVVLAWRFKDLIIEKSHRYIEGGGKFIVPLPEFIEIGDD